MTGKQLTKIEVEGYTSIRAAAVELRPMNVLVGANGAGKSNFIQALELLGRIVESRLGLFVGMNGGASTLLNTAGSSQIRVQLDAPPNSYEATFQAAANDELIFFSESVYFHGPDHPRAWSHSLGQGHRESRLPEAAEEGTQVAAYVLELLQGCRVFHFHDTSADAAVKQMVPTADNLALRQDAGNLAAVLLTLRESDKAAYQRIVGAIRQVAPFFGDFVLKPEAG